MKKILSFSYFCLFCPLAFAMECSDGEKLVKITGDQIGYSMYNETVYANKLGKCGDYDFKCDSETGGKWKLRNKDKPDDFNITGQALCLDSTEFNTNAKIGPYCYCKIQEIDNYKVLSDWINVEFYQNNIFDENKKYSSETEKTRQKNQINDKNNQECMNNCAHTCQSRLYKLIKTVHGYYVCAKALYKMTNVLCGIGDKIIKAKTIQVFDNIAEINMGDTSIIFTKDSLNSKETIYTGEFEYEPVYLKIQNNSVYVGHKLYSMEKCL